MVLIFIFGSCIFSFLNVVVYRLPRGLEFEMGRSRCPHCQSTIGTLDKIPVLGWFLVQGKCRNCGREISLRYPVVEFIGAVLAVMCAWKYGFGMRALFSFLFLCILTVTTLIDMDIMKIPFSVVISAELIGAMSCLFFPEITVPERVIGALCVSVPLYLLTLLVPGAFGGGDIKLTAACGIFLGWKLNLLSLFLAVLGGGSYGIWLLATKRKKETDHFAFGPFLSAGMTVAMFAGEAILGWYLGFF